MASLTVNTSNPTPSHANDASFDPDALFREVRDTFLASLQPKQRRIFQPCDSPQQLLDDLRNFKPLAAKPSLLRRCVQKVQKFSDALQPYFEAIGIVIQSHPEVAALVWGAVRLVLQLAANFTTFFEKLTQTLDTLTDELPRYNELMEHINERMLMLRRVDGKREEALKAMAGDPNVSASKIMASLPRWKPPLRLKHSLCVFYRDLFQFIQSVIGIFTKKDGAMRSSFAVVSDLFWRPYDLRFKDLLEQLEHHRTIVDVELRIAGFTTTTIIASIVEQEAVLAAVRRMENRVQDTSLNRKLDAIDQKIDAEHRASSITTIRQWLDPPQFTGELERGLEQRETDTTEWLFSETTFLKWRDKPRTIPTEKKSDLSQSCFWIHGNPGCGKTVLAASTVEEFRGCYGPDSTCYFFFRSGGNRAELTIEAYRAILAQTLQQHRANWPLVNKFLFAMTENASGQSQASKRELLDLMHLCTEGGYIRYIILDGVDECPDGEKLVTELPDILGDTTAKLVVFSRPHLTKMSQLSGESHLPLAKRLEPDIRLFLSNKMVEMARERFFPTGYDVKGGVDRLVNGADGMFLWAQLMLTYLSSPIMTPKRRKAEIDCIQTPEGLDTMYDRIVNIMLNRNSREKEFIKWVLMWMAYGVRDFTSLELQGSLKLLGDGYDDIFDLADFDSTVLAMCASLVERYQANRSTEGETESRYRLIHLSTREYLIARSSVKLQSLMFGEVEASIKTTKGCLMYLSKHGPPEPGDDDYKEGTARSIMDPGFPFYSYAAKYWIAHFYQIQKWCCEERELQGSELLHLTGFICVVTALADLLSSGSTLRRFIETIYTVPEDSWSIAEMADTLIECCEWSEATFDPEPCDRRQFERMYANTQKFAAYLKELNVEWGQTLRKSPQSIWTEVTAFTPCELLDTDQSTRIYRLSKTAPQTKNLSSKYLCRISEVGEDRRHLAVLTVWPSKVYQDFVVSFREREPDREEAYVHHVKATAGDINKKEAQSEADVLRSLRRDPNESPEEPEDQYPQDQIIDSGAFSSKMTDSFLKKYTASKKSLVVRRRDPDKEEAPHYLFDAKEARKAFHVLSKDFLRTPVSKFSQNIDLAIHNIKSVADKETPRKIKQACAGWIAQYELWELSEDPRVVLSESLALDAEEVWLQCSQSFWNGKLQFPISISQRLDRVGILRDVVSLHTSKFLRSRSVASTRLPLETITNGHWRPKKEDLTTVTDAKGCFTKNLDQCLYWTHFSPDSTSIFTLSLIPNRSRCYLTVTEIDSQLGGRISVGRSLNNLLVWKVKDIVRAKQCFHPALTLIAFSLSDTVFLWTYNGKRPSRSLILYPYNMDTVTDPGIAHLWSRTFPSEIQELGFSLCGQYLVVQQQQKQGQEQDSSPGIIRIPQHILAECTKVRNMPSSDEDDTYSAYASTSPHNSLSTTANFDAFSGQLIPSTSTMMSCPSGGSQIQVSASQGKIQMALRTISPQGKTRSQDIELTKLPDSWANLDSSKITMQVPKTTEDVIQLILNKAAKPWYDLSEEVDVNLPAVIQRDKHTVRKRNLGSSAVELLGGVKKEDHHGRERGKRSEPPSKQRKLRGS